MLSRWQQMWGSLDRSVNPVWGRRMSLLYGMGVWTMLGFLFFKWMPTQNVVEAIHANIPPKQFEKLSEEERQRLIDARNSAILKRQQELAEYVAENMYTPVDFMG